MTDRLVFLHGFTQTHHHWQPCAHLIAARLPEHPDLAFLDLPGHGLGSDDHRSIEAVADEIPHLGGTGTYIGYSMGGRHLLAAAVRRPPEIERLVVIGAHAGLTDPDDRAARVAEDEARARRVDLVGTDEAGSFRSTLSRNLKWMAEPAMREHLQHSDFSLRRIVQQNGSVYVVLPPDLIGDFRNWLRVIVRVALSAKIAQGDNQPGPQTLFLLDEFPILGRMKSIEESAGYMRSYGIKLVPMIQNIGQVCDLYAKNWETFLGNAAAVIAWGLNDQESEEYISSRLGKVMVWETSHGINSGTSGHMLHASNSSGHSSTTALRERPVMFASDVHALGARETGRAFVVPASGRPFMVQRVPYMSLAAAAVYDSREHIAAWEINHNRE